MADLIHSPEHYTKGAPILEPIDIIRNAPFDIGNMLKYLFRAEYKGTPLLDYKKAQYYADSAAQSCQQTGLSQYYNWFLASKVWYIKKYPMFESITGYNWEPRAFIFYCQCLIKSKIEEYEKKEDSIDHNL